MKLVIGADVSKKKLNISEYDGKNHKLKVTLNKSSDIERFLKKYDKSKKDLLFVMEATGIYHLQLANILYERGFLVSVVNPLIIKRYAEMKMLRAKTDKVDAKVIAQYGYEQDVKLFQPRSKKRQRIIKILKAIEDLTVSKNSYLNRLEALDKDPLKERSVEECFNKLISELNISIKRLEKELKNLINKHYLNEYSRLLSISGVGPKTAIIIIAFFGRFEDFKNSKQVVSYIGTNPSPKESGSSLRGRGRISQKGNSYLRKQLFMTSLSAMQHNNACKNMYERLSLKGKEHKVLRVAVLNKLVRQIFVVLKYDREYDPNYEEKFTSLVYA